MQRLVVLLGFDFAQHRQTLRPSVDGTRSKALRPFGFQYSGVTLNVARPDMNNYATLGVMLY